jgi:hypothetical protein
VRSLKWLALREASNFETESTPRVREKRGQPFVSTDNEALTVTAMDVSNPERSPPGIDG